ALSISTDVIKRDPVAIVLSIMAAIVCVGQGWKQSERERERERNKKREMNLNVSTTLSNDLLVFSLRRGAAALQRGTALGLTPLYPLSCSWLTFVGGFGKHERVSPAHTYRPN